MQRINKYKKDTVSKHCLAITQTLAKIQTAAVLKRWKIPNGRRPM